MVWCYRGHVSSTAYIVSFCYFFKRFNIRMESYSDSLLSFTDIYTHCRLSVCQCCTSMTFLEEEKACVGYAWCMLLLCFGNKICIKYYKCIVLFMFSFAMEQSIDNIIDYDACVTELALVRPYCKLRQADWSSQVTGSRKETPRGSLGTLQEWMCLSHRSPDGVEARTYT